MITLLENRPMKHRFLPLLLILSFLLVPIVRAWRPMPNRRRRALTNPQVGSKPQQPAADQAATEPKTDADKVDTDKIDPDKADSDKPIRPKTGSRPTSMDITAEPGGLKTLTIHFRWSLFPNASIEVRLVPGERERRGHGLADLLRGASQRHGSRSLVYLPRPSGRGRPDP